MDKPKTFISLSDYPEEICLFIPIEKCCKECPFCFNKKAFSKNFFPHNIRLEIDKNKDNVGAVIFGAGEPLEFEDLIISTAKYAKKNGLKVGIQTSKITSFNIKKIKDNFDYVSFTVNSIKGNQQKIFEDLGDKIELKFIYIPGKTQKFFRYYPSLMKKINVVQQFIPGECLNPEYNKIPKPTRDEVYDFAKSVGAQYIITQENGRELIK